MSLRISLIKGEKMTEFKAEDGEELTVPTPLSNVVAMTYRERDDPILEVQFPTDSEGRGAAIRGMEVLGKMILPRLRMTRLECCVIAEYVERLD